MLIASAIRRLSLSRALTSRAARDRSRRGFSRSRVISLLSAACEPVKVSIDERGDDGWGGGGEGVAKVAWK
jgi:hypothetical protein